MNKKNTTKKSIKPAYTVDLSMCNDSDDLKMAMIFAKAEAKVPVSKDELEYMAMRIIKTSFDLKDVVNRALDDVEDFLDILTKDCEKKPWYKRFWNWLTGRK